MLLIVSMGTTGLALDGGSGPTARILPRYGDFELAACESFLEGLHFVHGVGGNDGIELALLRVAQFRTSATGAVQAIDQEFAADRSRRALQSRGGVHLCPLLHDVR